jgi:hypothetical protein
MAKRMKLYSIILWMVFVLCAHVQAQDKYFVTYVKGTVLLAKTNTAVKVGDALNIKDQVILKDKNAVLSLINPKKGRFTMSADQTKTTAQGEFMAILESIISPLGGAKRLSTRSGNIINVLDFQTYFKERLLFIDEAKIPVSSEAFPTNDKSFFFLRYDYKGEVINKKLSANNDTLLISSSYAMIDGNAIPTEEIANVKLFYLSGGQAQLITPVDFILVSSELLKPEISVLTNALRSQDPNITLERLVDEISDHLNVYYGKPLPEDVVRLARGN